MHDISLIEYDDCMRTQKESGEKNTEKNYIPIELAVLRHKIPPTLHVCTKVPPVKS